MLKYQMYHDADYSYYCPTNLNSALPTWQFSKFRSVILPQITLSKHNYNRMSCEENTKRLHVQNGGQQ
jgi:hypothetical protein